MHATGGVAECGVDDVRGEGEEGVGQSVGAGVCG